VRAVRELQDHHQEPTMSVKCWKPAENQTETGGHKKIPVHPATAKMYALKIGIRKQKMQSEVAKGPSGSVAHYHRRKE